MKKRRRRNMLWNNRGEVNAPDDEDDEDLIAGDDDDVGDEGDGDLEVDLDSEDEKAAKEERARNAAFAAMRKENKDLKDAVDNLTTQVSNVTKPTITAPAPAQDYGVPKTDEEWDALAQKDWKKAVDLRSIQNAQNLLKKQKESTRADSTLEESKQKVLAVHPEINDNNSEKSKIFVQILNDNPDYRNQPKGPLYAMRDMEEYMENTLGYKRGEIRTAEKNGAQREASRQNRIVLNKGSGRTNSKTGNKIVLGKDEMEFCKFQNIDPKEYARNKQKLSKSKTNEVST